MGENVLRNLSHSAGLEILCHLWYVSLPIIWLYLHISGPALSWTSFNQSVSEFRLNIVLWAMSSSHTWSYPKVSIPTLLYTLTSSMYLLHVPITFCSLWHHYLQIEFGKLFLCYFLPSFFTLLRVATQTSEHSFNTFNICVFVVDSHRLSEGVFINNLWTVLQM